eukprot:CAMPEP_0206424934 /NCGR_PEP_ID=MMETSP0324_2-20121206/3506_1 /ASSEMBLY_ACC=CAM_ASM_000836 /TAXON_ID=2866 /ORGANISM="Crypthecodinium cohnii, Strain Seligo" /LENGTH=189 /DNA_ID=CAMNT_0053889649 /DNA_START=14 /DNA_END=580 /DNA_ORIENTATION=-
MALPSFLLDKKTAPYVIWTLVAVVCALFFWLTRGSDEKSEEQGSAASNRNGSAKTGSSSAPRSKNRSKVTVALDGTLLSAPTQELQEAAIAPLLTLCETSELFTIALAQTDADEDRVRSVLESCGVYSKGLRHHRVMFSSTPEGRASMVRQLQPALHIESDVNVATALSGKIPSLRLVGTEDWPDFATA